MALQIRRGTNAQRQLLSGDNTPAEGELLYVTDWATAGVSPLWIGDGVTAGGIEIAVGGGSPVTPTYALARSAASVDEGGTVTITLTTTNVSDGTAVPFTISGTGITGPDLGLPSLVGNFNVTSNSASLNLNIASDFTTEGAESFTLTLDGISPAVSVSVTVNDTSTSLVDGGGPTDTFDLTVDGGGPSTTEFELVLDGGTP